MLITPPPVVINWIRTEDIIIIKFCSKGVGWHGAYVSWPKMVCDYENTCTRSHAHTHQKKLQSIHIINLNLHHLHTHGDTTPTNMTDSSNIAVLLEIHNSCTKITPTLGSVFSADFLSPHHCLPHKILEIQATQILASAHTSNYFLWYCMAYSYNYKTFHTVFAIQGLHCTIS